MILLDTHVLVWYLGDDKRIGKRAMATIEKAIAREEIRVSPITFWEIGMLVERRRLALDMTPAAFRVLAMTNGIEEDSLDGYLAITAAELPATHNDPADRFIVATAILQGLTLVTADAVLLDWKLRGLKTQDATV